MNEVSFKEIRSCRTNIFIFITMGNVFSYFGVTRFEETQEKSMASSVDSAH
jgi:hypothetical protein